MTFEEYCKHLEAKIINSYMNGVTLDAAERLAGEFLAAQMKVSDELKSADLDSRMKKTGVKSIRAAIYLDILQKNDKKPTEAAIQSLIDSDKLVTSEQELYDRAEVDRDSLERYYNIFREAHMHFRAIAKGRFE